MRTELIGAVGLVAALALAGGAIALRLALFAIPELCFTGEADPACVGRQQDLFDYQSVATWLTPGAFGAAFAPPLAGVLLGIGMVGKELDQRTAVLAWSVSPDRRRWLLQRIVPILGLLAALGIGCSLLVVTFLRSVYPGMGEFPADFSTIQFIGLGPAALGVSAFGVTVLIGAMLGRLLPIVLAAAVFVFLSASLITLVNERLMARETVIGPYELVGRGRVVDPLLRTPDGRIISWNDAWPEFMDPQTGQVLPGVTEMARFVPIEIYPQVAARYVLLLLALGLGCVTLAFAVVERRTP
jgi:hypothetical protein